MISEVDEVLRTMVGDELLSGSGAEVSFEAPTTDWAARRTGPVVNIFLYDLREDRARLEQGRIPEYDADGRTVAWYEPPRYFALSYLVTAWTNHPTDEHRLLSTLLSGLLAYDHLPPGRLTGSLAASGRSVPVSVGVPLGDGRALADVWSALGGQLKPSLDLVVTAPIAVRRTPAAPPALDRVVRLHDESDGARARRRGGDPDAARCGGSEPAARGGPAGVAPGYGIGGLAPGRRPRRGSP